MFIYRDGTARLWNVAESKCIATLAQVESEINCCCIKQVTDMLLPGDNSKQGIIFVYSFQTEFKTMVILLGELEFETQGKLLAIGCDDGLVAFISVQGKEIIGTVKFSHSVRSICWTKNLSLLVGLEDGSIFEINPKVRRNITVLFDFI